MRVPVSVSTFVLCICLTVKTDAVASGTIRLYRNGISDTSQSWSSGIIQIYYSSSWGNICDDSSFGSDEADVICHQLGYSGASSYSNTGSTTTWGSDYSTTKLQVSCLTSSYLTITQCSFSTSISSSCTDNTDVTVSCYSSRIWDSPSSGDIRLTGGTYSNEGLLEVYCNGQWGTVCDNSFYSTEARIACRQLGYNYYDTYDQLSQRGTSGQNIWLNTAGTCSSTVDNCLTSCGGCPTSAITSCSHSQDITLACEYNFNYNKVNTVTGKNCDTDSSDISPIGTIRLYRNGISDTSQSWSSGIVQIYWSSGWGNICDDSSFGSDEAHVICHQLGYTGASSYISSGSVATSWGVDYSSTVMDDVSCSSSSYLTITQCSFRTSISSSCTHDTDVFVSCYSTRIWDSPSSGDIRLTGGMYSNEGLLEVYCNGQWGTVCDNYFDSTEAKIACSQLGYNYYYTYNQLSIQGTSSQSIWLWVFSGCSLSSDSCLTDCGGCPSDAVTGCRHAEDVTLVCDYSSSFVSVSTDISTSCDISADAPSATSGGSGVGVGAIVGSVTGIFVCLVIIIVPICLCMFFGGALTSRSQNVRVTTPRTTVTTSAAATGVRENTDNTVVPNQVVYYPAQPDQSQQTASTTGYPPSQQPASVGHSYPVYPIEPSFDPPPEYPSQPPPGYPTQQQPPSGYPSQQQLLSTFPINTQPQEPPAQYGEKQYPPPAPP